MADFTVYGAVVVGIAVQLPDARLAAVALLYTYYVSGAAFLAWSSLAGGVHPDDPGGLAVDDDRSLRFVGGLAEGFETIAAMTLVFVFPRHAETILWVFATLVAVTAVQRVVFAVRYLPGRAPR